MPETHWDNWLLPINDKYGLTHSCKDLAIYFINIYCFKQNFDNQFRLNHPQRLRFSDEPVENYDSYLTQHLNAYRDLLGKNKYQYMQDSDVHLSDKINSLLYADNQLTIHPQLGRVMNNLNLVPMLVCLTLYNFTDILKSQDVGYSLQMKDIQMSRSNFVYRSLGDIIRLFSVVFTSNVELNISYFVANKVTKTETKLSKLAKKIFFTKHKQYGNFWETTVNWLNT